ncbi:hypothetical protein [Micromonospora lupini]|uniref:Uncharacterized protein n=1 Tax=Micromonospora lupini str. Lupac 08 TaxID=1150864 RepID=I0L1Z0_9ACTN|nr:hypothetical protein [Micromonospora lupini]CCH17837.1 hypothetical protein MILUP08_42768 [Micromonospora lupini str. Lupac 08]
MAAIRPNCRVGALCEKKDSGIDMEWFSSLHVSINLDVYRVLQKTQPVNLRVDISTVIQ